MKQKILDDFEASYAENCNQDNMRKKHREVGNDSPFHADNAPPDQYLIPEVIMEKPCKLSLKGSDSKKVPYSGKMGVLGYRIIDNHRKA